MNEATKPLTRVRDAGASDYAAIRDLLREGDAFHRQMSLFGWHSEPQDYPREAYDVVMADPAAIVLIAEHNVALAGFLRSAVVEQPRTRVRAHRHFLIVHEIVVAEAFRGLGIGTALTAAIKAEARKRALENVELNVHAANIAARAFYRREDFVEESLRLRYDVAPRPGTGGQP